MIIEQGKIINNNGRMYLAGDILAYHIEDLSVPSIDFIWRVFSESHYNMLPVGITTDVMSRIPMVIFTEPGGPSDEISDELKVIENEINSENTFKCIGITMYDDDHYIIIKHPSYDSTQIQMDDTMKEIGNRLYNAMHNDPMFDQFKVGHRNALFYKSQRHPILYLDDKICIMLDKCKLFDSRYKMKTTQIYEPVLPFKTKSDDQYYLSFLYNGTPHVCNSAPGQIGTHYSVMFNYVIEKIINGGN